MLPRGTINFIYLFILYKKYWYRLNDLLYIYICHAFLKIMKIHMSYAQNTKSFRSQANDAVNKVLLTNIKALAGMETISHDLIESKLKIFF